ncbi:MAG: hypothetical protein ND866_31285 [Pyrinomonadaceae bacterium]|nr:hypothetical protein [Pyrinomonadaceae bacterium]
MPRNPDARTHTNTIRLGRKRTYQAAARSEPFRKRQRAKKRALWEMVINTLYAMQRANGDWFALDDHGKFRVPIFHSIREAMIARSRDTGMECFKPVVLDEAAFVKLTTTDEGKACFWLVGDPSINLSRGRALDHAQLALVMHNGNGRPKDNAVE